MSEVSWRRELPDFVSVSLDGDVGGIDPDVTLRAPGRVVIVMPDFTADAVAHVLGRLGDLADRFGMERDWMGERELAAALADAAAEAGYHCPDRPVTGEVA